MFRDKRSTKICKNVFIPIGGYQDIDFIKKIFPKNVVKMMNKHYLHKYIVSYYLEYSKTLIQHYIAENLNI